MSMNRNKNNKKIDKGGKIERKKAKTQKETMKVERRKERENK